MNTLTQQQVNQLKALANQPDADIDTLSIPEITDFTHAVVGKFYRPVKKKATTRLNANIDG